MSQSMCLPLVKATNLLTRNSQKPCFELEKQRLCSSRFRRMCFSNSKSMYSVDTEFTEATGLSRKATLVLVEISQNMFSNTNKYNNVETTGLVWMSRSALFQNATILQSR